MMPWNRPSFLRLLEIAVEEDLNSGDATSDALIPPDTRCRAQIITRCHCVVSGQHVAAKVFHEVDPSVDYTIRIDDGTTVSDSTVIAAVTGNTRSILAGERLALNFLQRMSGIASETRILVDTISDTSCRVIDTRKTVPGFRYLDKYAVSSGGGGNHRMNLGDGILIKDNHIEACGDVTTAVKRAISRSRHTLRIQVEVKNRDEALAAVTAGADALLLDNMKPDDIRKIITALPRQLLLECSGNISRDTIREYAETGVDLISVGALTHSVRAADLSLLILK